MRKAPKQNLSKCDAVATDRGIEGVANATHPTGFLRGAQQGECPPINKMGVTKTGSGSTGVELVTLVMTDSGEVKQIPVRKHSNGQIAHIDWVNFTVHESTWNTSSRSILVTDDEFIREASRVLEGIFGFGINEHRDRGMNFYRDSWVLGRDMGFVCFGGQRNTMLVTLNGTGCLHAKDGWEERLFEFLSSVAVRPTLTRVDLAHDDFTGETINVDWLEQQYHVRGFSCSFGAPPDIERKGNWHRPTGKGRTITIGQRTSGKFLRGYEKGRKEGDKESPWVRAEVEFKNSDRVLPFDILTAPSDYFLAAYPCFAHLSEQITPKRIEIKHETAVINMDRAIEVTKHQFGKHLSVFRQIYGDDKMVLDIVCHKDPNAWPKRLAQIAVSGDDTPTPIHRLDPIESPSFLDLPPSPPASSYSGIIGLTSSLTH